MGKCLPINIDFTNCRNFYKEHLDCRPASPISPLSNSLNSPPNSPLSHSSNSPFSLNSPNSHIYYSQVLLRPQKKPPLLPQYPTDVSSFNSSPTLSSSHLSKTGEFSITPDVLLEKHLANDVYDFWNQRLANYMYDCWNDAIQVPDEMMAKHFLVEQYDMLFGKKDDQVKRLRNAGEKWRTKTESNGCTFSSLGEGSIMRIRTHCASEKTLHSWRSKSEKANQVKRLRIAGEKWRTKTKSNGWTFSSLREGSPVRMCTHCASAKTPQWRRGPKGPKTLCNACGVRYKTGRLYDEYRPALSPTYMVNQHSNLHRKVLELRRQKDMILVKQEA